MDKWVSDDTVFISSSLKSSDGVAQVHKLVTSGDIPLEEDSFSFIGEALDPSTIAPLVQWQRNDYIRLLHFLHINSLMVNASGHVILKSAAKSRIISRADDGPTTYWRYLDLLPMQAYGLPKPHNMVTKPMFLIIGGEVDELDTTTENTTDEGNEDLNDLELTVQCGNKYYYMYWDLEANFKTLISELQNVKGKLAQADNSLIISQAKNNELTKYLENWKSANEQLQNILNTTNAELQKANKENERLQNILKTTTAEGHKAIEENKQLQIRIDEIEVAKKKATDEIGKLRAEISNLQSTTKAELKKASEENERLQNILKTTTAEGYKAIEENKQLQIRIDEIEVAKKKATDEICKLRAEISNLQSTTKAELQKANEENERLQNILETTTAEGHKAIEENKQLQIRIDEIEVAMKKATDEICKLREEISNLPSNSVPASVTDNNLKNENDLLIVKLFEKSFGLCYIGPQHISKCFVQMKELTTDWGTKFTEEMPIRGKKTMVGAEWNIYVDGQTTYAITVAPYKDQGKFRWNKAFVGWEYSYNSGRLVFKH